MSGAGTDAGGSGGQRMAIYPYRRIDGVPDPTPADGPDPYGEPDPDWLRIDWRRHLRRIGVDGTEVNYAELGSGPPIVLIHGLGGSWQNWLENIPPLAGAGHRVIALDLPGFGWSPMPDWEPSIPRYAELLDRFVAALGIEGCTLVGNSLGGFIAAEAAIGGDEWLRRLLLVSAAGISHSEMRPEPAERIARLLLAVTPLLSRIRDQAFRRPRLRAAAFGGVFRHPERIRPELLWEFSEANAVAVGTLPAVAGLVGHDFLDRLGRIAVPATILWGRDDRVVPAADASGFVERIPGAELVVFEDCGHVPMAERPVRFNRLLVRFAAG